MNEANVPIGAPENIDAIEADIARGGVGGEHLARHASVGRAAVLTLAMSAQSSVRVNRSGAGAGAGARSEVVSRTRHLFERFEIPVFVECGIEQQHQFVRRGSTRPRRPCRGRRRAARHLCRTRELGSARRIAAATARLSHHSFEGRRLVTPLGRLVAE